jgi:hypothetical protein
LPVAKIHRYTCAVPPVSAPVAPARSGAPETLVVCSIRVSQSVAETGLGLHSSTARALFAKAAVAGMLMVTTPASPSYAPLPLEESMVEVCTVVGVAVAPVATAPATPLNQVPPALRTPTTTTARNLWEACHAREVFISREVRPCELGY